MSWSLYRWTWRLEAPLHIGMPPAGSINRCRLYIPARALWGALTAELARRQSGNFPDYAKIGEQLRKETRLGYLFPAEQVSGEWTAWLPLYQEGKGLVWKREGSDMELEDRAFRMRLLSTRPGTAIEPESDTAAEGSLRETEIVNPVWREATGTPGSQVAFVGYLFARNDDMADTAATIRIAGCNVPDILWVGGDTRYGFGKLQRLACESAKDFFGCTVDLSGADPVVDSPRLLAHADVVDGTQSGLQGQQEIMAGWDYGRLEPKPTVLWQPGSAAGCNVRWLIHTDWYWEFKANDSAQT
jgi:hypothetical protein